MFFLFSLLIIKVLQKKFKFKAKLIPVGSNLAETQLSVDKYSEDFYSKYYIYIPKEYMIDLKKKVSNFIIPEMKHKLLP